MTATQPQFQYESFELLIGADNAGAGYRLTVLESPAGEGNGYCCLDPFNRELGDALWALQHETVDAAYLREIGGFLFDELFVDDVAALLRTSLGMVRAAGTALRVRLRIEAPELQALPWEYLHDPDEDASLAIAAETALVRYLPLRLPVRPTQLTLPLRILLVIANPAGTDLLETAHERATVEDALATWIEQGKVELTIVERATVPAINETMRRVQPHVFHYIGHGVVNERDGAEQAYIMLEDEAGQAHPVDERTFREFFSNSRETRLAVLNACQTATLSSTQPLVGLAPRLLQRQLSAVVAMQAPILDQAALIFAREFYRGLALGYPIDAAISEARKGIYMELGAHEPAWGVPVLFLRAKSGQLFTLDAPEADAVNIPPPPEPVKPPRVPDFVGRVRERELYLSSLREHGLAVIAGMAGVGKSALAAEVAQAFGAPDKTFWHTFHLDEGIETITWKLAGFLAWHGRSDLWTMLQSTAQTGGKPPPPDVLFDYLIQLIRGQDYLICLDDFQRVDDDPLLDRLTERLRPLLRAGEIRMLLTSRRIPDFVQIDVSPLDGLALADAQRLLDARAIALPDGMLAELHRRLEGNAELLILTIEALQKSMAPQQLLANLVEAANIERYLLSEIDRDLRDDERRVMNGVAALMGYPGTRDAIEETLGGVNARRHLSYLTNRYLLQQLDGEVDREYGQHAIVQAFYYELLSRRERAAMHRRAAEYYEQEEVDPLRAAIHYERAGEYEQAAELAVNSIEQAINSGRSRQAHDLLTRVVARRLPSALQLSTWLALAELQTFLGERNAAERNYRHVLTAAATQQEQDAGDSIALNQLMVEAHLGLALRWLKEDPNQTLYWVEQGLSVEQTKLSAIVRARLLIVQANAQMDLARYDEALRATELGLALLPAGHLHIQIDALLNRTTILMLQGNLVKALTQGEQTLALAHSSGDRHREHKALHNLATVQMLAGAWDDAVANYHRSTQVAEQLGDSDGALFSQINLSLLMVDRGEWQAAEAAADRVQKVAEQRNLLHERQLAILCKAMIYSTRDGLHTQADTVATGVEREAHALGIDSTEVFALWLRALFLRRAGNLADAEQQAQAAMALAESIGEWADYAIAQREYGAVLAARGAEIDAEQVLQESLARLEEHGDIYHGALARLELGALWWTAGQIDAAKAAMLAALDIFQVLAARPAEQQLRETCCKLGLSLA